MCIRDRFVTGLLAQRLKKPTVLGYLGANFAGLAVVYVVGMVYYYVICNYVIASPIGLWPLILYCCILAIPGDIALSIPVSYTHLDVYKRQTSLSASWEIADAGTCAPYKVAAHSRASATGFTFIIRPLF